MLQTLKATIGYTRVVMAPNSDPGCEGIHQALRQAGVVVLSHLPRSRFLSMLAGAGVIVGNSSAGLIEAAVLKTPCVNVGPRQDGREKPASVIDCAYGTTTIKNAVEAAFQLDLRHARHPYGREGAGQRIARTLAGVDLDRIPLHKKNTY